VSAGNPVIAVDLVPAAGPGAAKFGIWLREQLSSKHFQYLPDQALVFVTGGNNSAVRTTREIRLRNTHVNGPTSVAERYRSWSWV
jgi:hypothetical protein